MEARWDSGEEDVAGREAPVVAGAAHDMVVTLLDAARRNMESAERIAEAAARLATAATAAAIQPAGAQPARLPRPEAWREWRSGMVVAGAVGAIGLVAVAALGGFYAGRSSASNEVGWQGATAPGAAASFVPIVPRTAASPQQLVPEPAPQR